MSSPVPKPRSDVKKPVPTPRRLGGSRNETKSVDDNSFSRKAKQKLEGLGEGTRQSLRKLSRRFSSVSTKENITDVPDTNSEPPEGIEVFNSITFESPISKNDVVYGNVNADSDSNGSNESVNLPPPLHPPPPLPTSLYDAPASVRNPPLKINNYETVFPLSSETSESCLDRSDMQSLSSSASWRFYDTVPNLRDKLPVLQRERNDTPQTPPIEMSSSVSTSSVDVRNSFYENCELKPTNRPTKSVIMQFDPLNESSVTNNNVGQMKDLQLLEQLLQGDLYGTAASNTIDEWSISNESDLEAEYPNPPTPPMRFDSLPEEEQVQTRSQFYDNIDEENTNAKNNNNTDANESKRITWNKLKDVFKGSKPKEQEVERPQITVKRSLLKKGMLFKVQNRVEGLFGEYSARWCVLENSTLICFADSTCNSVKEHIIAAQVLSIQIVQDSKYRHNNDELHCFELNVTGKSRGNHIYGSRNISDRRVWMQCIAECLTNKFSATIISEYQRLGWAFIREGLGDKWEGAWIVLYNRELYYATNNSSPKKVDLRKARLVALQQQQPEKEKCPPTSDKGPNMLIDCPQLVVYFRMWTARETKVWCQVVKTSAHNNGANLDQQQLTKHNIPVLVETCINFIYLHGSMSEGIYRKPGSSSAIADILTRFRSDAFSVHLKTDKYSEYDVATALKRFFRDLPQPLLKSDQHQYLYQVSKINSKEEKIRMFKAVLEELPEISFKTVRKLLGHLHFITTQQEKNRMGIENLANIWGGTLMHSESDSSKRNFENSAEVVGQLITHYHDIFPEDAGELQKEQVILKVLEKYYKSPQIMFEKKNAGDLRIWVYLHNKEGKTFNISIDPNKSAYNLCNELHVHMKLEVHELVVEEVVMNGRLIRPVHHTEKLLDVVLRWGYWDEQDRKDNYLVLSPLSKYWEYIQNINSVSVLGAELKFSDSKSKFFKSMMFQFSGATLVCYKDKNCETVLNSWRIEDVIWYFGHESKKSPHTKWCITFFELNSHPVRLKTSPYFGNILVWNDRISKSNWINAMLKARYPNNVAPPPQIVNI